MNKKTLKTFLAITTMVSMLSTGMVSFAAEEHVVQSGDSLKKIAKQSYGDEANWEVIYEANKDIIKNPNLIYAGQVLTIPDLTDNENNSAATNTAVDETVTTTETEVPVPATDAAALPVKNIPVGTNPVYMVDEYGTPGYMYTFRDGRWMFCCAETDNYSEITDIYGVTYREYDGEEGKKESVMKIAADYIAKNPDSNFASLFGQHGTQFVIVTNSGGLGNDESAADYAWAWGIMECVPDDCVYMFVSGLAFESGDEDWLEEVCYELFDSVSEEVTIS